MVLTTSTPVIRTSSRMCRMCRIKRSAVSRRARGTRSEGMMTPQCQWVATLPPTSLRRLVLIRTSHHQPRPPQSIILILMLLQIWTIQTHPFLPLLMRIIILALPHLPSLLTRMSSRHKTAARLTVLPQTRTGTALLVRRRTTAFACRRPRSGPFWG